MTADDLRSWRERLGLNQSQAARCIGCARNSILAYEKGRKIPRYIALACAAVAYGLPPIGEKP